MSLPVLDRSPAARLVLLLSAGLVLAGAAEAQTLVPTGAVWRHRVTGLPSGAWTTIAYDDSAWGQGPAELGYGDGDEATVLSFGPNPSQKQISYYFRHAFQVAAPPQVGNLRLRILCDDGAVVYLNGSEVRRVNMAGGTVLDGTLAQGHVDSFEETFFHTYDVDPALLVAGTNVLAVEVHQFGPSSSDLSFDLELASNVTPSVIRGPYLQRGAPDSIVLRWRTDVATDARVWLGSSPGTLVPVKDVALETQEHDVALEGLATNTTYYYAVGTPAQGPLAGDDADHRFETSPRPGRPHPMRIWVLGDSGTANLDQLLVRNAYTSLPGSDATDFALLLGDNAYTRGTDGEYEFALFAMYGAFMKSRVFWPTRGNHEFVADTFYEVFSMPTAGEAGGLPSGTEAYYSFDWANVHFVSLDSQGSDRSVGGPMWTWLHADLLSTAQDWIVAFWHHPPYTKGSHDSDFEPNLVQMRQNFLPVLEACGVDLVLGGHSHAYERSHLIDGHYGRTPTWDPRTMLVDGGDGDPGGDGAYRKAQEGAPGAVYCVAGSAGKISGGSLDHPVMCVSLNELGSLLLEIDGDVLEARFVDVNGSFDDRFAIRRGRRATRPPTDPAVEPPAAVPTAKQP